MKFFIATTALVLLAATGTIAIQAQERDAILGGIATTQKTAQETARQVLSGQTQFPNSGRRIFIVDEKSSQQAKLAKEIISTDDVAKKQAAQVELTKLLNEEFNQDIQRRQSELDEIKKRVSELEAVLTQRIANQENIVQLRLQVLANEARGLDWSSNGSQPFGFGTTAWSPRGNGVFDLRTRTLESK